MEGYRLVIVEIIDDDGDLSQQLKIYRSRYLAGTAMDNIYHNEYRFRVLVLQLYVILRGRRALFPIATTFKHLLEVFGSECQMF
jgi:hypothetical protein